MNSKQSSIFILVAVILSGCSANWHLKRAARHELIAISKGAQPKVDTFYKVVKYRVKEISKDTLFLTRPGDTVRISRDKLKIVYVDLPGDSVYVAGKCEADTIRVTVPVTVTKVVSAAKSWMSNWVLFILIGFAVGVAACLFLRK